MHVGKVASCAFQVTPESPACQSLSRVGLCDPMDCSPPGSLSMEFSRQEYWSR